MGVFGCVSLDIILSSPWAQIAGRRLKTKGGSSSLVSLAALTMTEREKLQSSRPHLNRV